MTDRTIEWVFTAVDRLGPPLRSVESKLSRVDKSLRGVATATKLIGGVAGAATLTVLVRRMIQAADASGQLDDSIRQSFGSVQKAFRDVSATMVNAFAPAVLVVAEAAAIRIPQAMAALSFSVVAARQRLVEVAATISSVFGGFELAADLRDQAKAYETELDQLGKALQAKLAVTKLEFPPIEAPEIKGGLDAAARAAAREAQKLEQEIAKVVSGIANLNKEATRFFTDRAAQLNVQFADPLQVLRSQIIEVNQLFSQGLIDTGTAGRAIEEYADAYKRSMDRVKEVNDETADSTNDLLRDIRSAAEGFGRELTDVFFDATNDIGDMFKNLAETIAKALFTNLVTQPLIEGILETIPIGRRAAGGPVSGGSPYVVGERGPELFVPGSSGRIIPNGAMGGGPNIALNLTITSVDPQTAAATIVAQERLITGMVRRSFNRAGVRPQMA